MPGREPDRRAEYVAQLMDEAVRRGPVRRRIVANRTRDLRIWVAQLQASRHSPVVRRKWLLAMIATAVAVLVMLLVFFFGGDPIPPEPRQSPPPPVPSLNPPRAAAAPSASRIQQKRGRPYERPPSNTHPTTASAVPSPIMVPTSRAGQPSHSPAAPPATTDSASRCGLQVRISASAVVSLPPGARSVLGSQLALEAQLAADLLRIGCTRPEVVTAPDRRVGR